MAETITKPQQDAFIPSVIHNSNPSSQAICPPTGGDWKCDVSQAYGPNCHSLLIQYLFIILSDFYFPLAPWQIMFRMKCLDWYTVQCAWIQWMHSVLNPAWLYFLEYHLLWRKQTKGSLWRRKHFWCEVKRELSAFLLIWQWERNQAHRKWLFHLKGKAERPGWIIRPRPSLIAPEWDQNLYISLIREYLKVGTMAEIHGGIWWSSKVRQYLGAKIFDEYWGLGKNVTLSLPVLTLDHGVNFI